MRTDRVFRIASACAALGLAVAGCDTPSIATQDPGYDPETIAPFIYHWAPGHDIAIFVDRTGEPADADLDTAVRNGIAAWEGVGLLGEIRLHIVTDVHKADVIFHHATAPRLIGSETCSPVDIGAGGNTFFCVSDDMQSLVLPFNDGSGGHVKMDVAMERVVFPSQDAFRSGVMHELGHVLGIGAHSPNTTDLVYGVPRAAAPTSNDIATLRYVLSQRADVPF